MSSKETFRFPDEVINNLNVLEHFLRKLMKLILVLSHEKMELVRVIVLIIFNYCLKDILPSSGYIYTYISPIYICTLLRYGKYYYSGDISYVYDMLAVIVSVSGYGLYYYANRSLGQYYSRDLQVKEKHVLIKDGPYKYLVHPSYSGQILFLVGSLLFLRINWIIFGLLVGLTSYTTYRESNAEERRFHIHFDKEYFEYLTARRRFIPFIW